MRNILAAIALALGVLVLCLALGVMMSESQPEHGQLHNAYWPYSVEIQVRDR